MKSRPARTAKASALRGCYPIIIRLPRPTTDRLLCICTLSHVSIPHIVQNLCTPCVNRLQYIPSLSDPLPVSTRAIHPGPPTPGVPRSEAHPLHLGWPRLVTRRSDPPPDPVLFVIHLGYCVCLTHVAVRGELRSCPPLLSLLLVSARIPPNVVARHLNRMMSTSSDRMRALELVNASGSFDETMLSLEPIMSEPL